MAAGETEVNGRRSWSSGGGLCKGWGPQGTLSNPLGLEHRKATRGWVKSLVLKRVLPL